MAYRPDPLPNWYYNTYGADPLDWEEAKRQARAVLYQWAEEGKPQPWRELIRRVDAIQWLEGEARRAQLGQLLAAVDLDELVPDEDRPLISAMGFSEGTGDPGTGFWWMCDFLHEPVGSGSSKKARDDFWLDQVKRCKKLYKKGDSRPA